MDYVARGKVATARLDCIAEADRRPLVRLALDRRAARAADGRRDAAAVPQLRVRRVGDRVDLEGRHVNLEHFQPRHGHILPHIEASDHVMPKRVSPSQARLY